MRLLYGRHFSARYEAIAAEVPVGSSVVDVCAGDGYLYLNYLRAKPVRYQALDISPRLVQWMQRHGIQAQQFEVWHDTLPAGDIVIMQASLYQFLPDAAPVVEKMLRAARQSVIITEPIRNIASSDNPVLRFVGKRLTRPEQGGGEYQAHRFDQTSLMALAQQFPMLEKSCELPGGREMMIVLRRRAVSRE
ncbi:MAG: hypothetical protein HGB05_06650 [Chloroflexi bacterium]|nr:hypothetical protein [Chloroflexota bacterium]